MTKIEIFEPSNLKQLRSAMQSKMDELEEQFGVTISIGNCSFSSGEATFQTKVKSAGHSEIKSQELKSLAPMYGLACTETDMYKLVDIKTGSPKYPIVFMKKAEPNKQYKATQERGQELFGKVA